jgi:hypothetical protein
MQFLGKFYVEVSSDEDLDDVKAYFVSLGVPKWEASEMLRNAWITQIVWSPSRLSTVHDCEQHDESEKDPSVCFADATKKLVVAGLPERWFTNFMEQRNV